MYFCLLYLYLQLLHIFTFHKTYINKPLHLCTYLLQISTSVHILYVYYRLAQLSKHVLYTCRNVYICILHPSTLMYISEHILQNCTVVYTCTSLLNNSIIWSRNKCKLNITHSMLHGLMKLYKSPLDYVIAQNKEVIR